MDMQNAGTATIGTMRIIPGQSDIIGIPDNMNIEIKRTSVFEITLCGRISGVTLDNGASFYLQNVTKNEMVSDLIFELKKGNTNDMDFSETNFVDIEGPAFLQLKTNIDDTSTSNIKFTYMNIVIKSYKC